MTFMDVILKYMVIFELSIMETSTINLDGFSAYFEKIFFICNGHPKWSEYSKLRDARRTLYGLVDKFDTN